MKYHSLVTWRDLSFIIVCGDNPIFEICITSNRDRYIYILERHSSI